MTVEVDFRPSGRRAEVVPGETVLWASQRVGVPMASTCGGRGICGKCKVRLLKGRGGDLSSSEVQLLTPKEVADGYRLACHLFPQADVVVEVLPLSQDEPYKVILPGLGARPLLNPAVIKVFLQVPPPSLKDNRSDAERLESALGVKGVRAKVTDLAVLRLLPYTFRQGDYTLTVLVRDGRVINMRPGRWDGEPVGLAIDLGTTTVAAYLMGLETGRQLAASAASNRQMAFGADVMSRIHHAMLGGLRELQEAAVEVINELIARVCALATVDAADIYEATVVGNTCMQHLLLGISPECLGLAPYVPVSSGALDLSPQDMGLQLGPAARVHLLPSVGGFVGADAVAGALAAALHERAEPCLLMDIGTNAELVLGSRHGLVACSMAAGPAFEGACIKHGMQAGPGAIDRVEFSDKVHVSTLDGARPVGLAGSGLLSAVASLRRRGFLDERGLLVPKRLEGKAWFLSAGQRGAELVLVPAQWSGTREAIVVTQEDIVQLQLARAAVAAGLGILMEVAGLAVENIAEVFLAGAFGNYMDQDDAVALGLIPPPLADRVVGIGNAAGAGAILALLSVDNRRKAQDIARQARYIELSAWPHFNDRFISALPFPPLT